MTAVHISIPYLQAPEQAVREAAGTGHHAHSPACALTFCCAPSSSPLSTPTGARAGSHIPARSSRRRPPRGTVPPSARARGGEGPSPMPRHCLACLLLCSTRYCTTWPAWSLHSTSFWPAVECTKYRNYPLCSPPKCAFLMTCILTYIAQNACRAPTDLLSMRRPPSTC